MEVIITGDKKRNSNNTRYSVIVDGEVRWLTPDMFRIFLTLAYAYKKQTTVSHEDIDFADNSARYIYRLKQQLKLPSIIENVTSKGYRLVDVDSLSIKNTIFEDDPRVMRYVSQFERVSTL